MSQSQTAIDANTIRKIIRKMGHDATARVRVQHAHHGSYIHLDAWGMDREELEGEIRQANLEGCGRDYSIEW